ncbi:MAG: recombinase RecA [Planctomycetes bacterium]|nr:recombinase RecA [Planctomycetota bacterium]MCB9934700.1 recombinase RecA [Planctomycetota bacterium]
MAAKTAAPEKREDKRAEAVKMALAQIEKTHGKGSLMKLGDAPTVEIQGISTGALSFDLALGGRGVPRGRVIEIYGPESSGKTTITLQIIAEAQKRGGLAAFIDAEHALDPVYASKIGVDTENLYVSQPDSGEQALDICETLVRSNAFDIIVVDSVAALVPRSELEGDMGDAQMGSQARLMSQAMRKLTAAVSRAKTSLIFINQIRMKIGIVFGNPETTTGGNALKFAASQRIEVRKGKPIKVGEDVVGHEVNVKVVKNKLAPPFKKTTLEIIFNEGVSKLGDLLELGVQTGTVKRSGAWWTFGDTKLGQGKENAKAFLAENKDIWAQVDRATREALGMPVSEAAATTED